MRKMYLIAAAWLTLLILAACSNGADSGSGGKIAGTSLSEGPAEEAALPAPAARSDQPQSSSQPYLGKVYKVVVDPGHGGDDPGAVSVSGRMEKDFNLGLSEKIAANVEQDPQLEILLTRTGDAFISSQELFRPQFANNLPADLFISIHGNTYEDASASGTETFYYHEESLAWAETIHKHVIQATGLKDRGVKKGNFFVLRDTVMPSVLLELGYLTNPGDEAKMWTSGFQESVASAVVDGIREYLGLE
ncbi:N-acetylmuramoyl-L-alanine amidase [Paenibacillus sp. FSL P4-0338]|uniref:N-acetylmuramoyl-L-alanine amidase family protein n=1 Tax=unclassified Paenibacillus TaxID=185978 RepID=UPI0003E2B6E0|nr:N-acetylmuramoyl-L-alanine amidase [Paenibacillus sp. FSL R7-269]ETT34179.1 cell wall hydrolase/autolysin [Paenibacillus sp. FSL R7-269]